MNNKSYLLALLFTLHYAIKTSVIISAVGCNNMFNESVIPESG